MGKRRCIWKLIVHLEMSSDQQTSRRVKNPQSHKNIDLAEFFTDAPIIF